MYIGIGIYQYILANLSIYCQIFNLLSEVNLFFNLPTNVI